MTYFRKSDILGYNIDYDYNYGIDGYYRDYDINPVPIRRNLNIVFAYKRLNTSNKDNKDINLNTSNTDNKDNKDVKPIQSKENENKPIFFRYGLTEKDLNLLQLYDKKELLFFINNSILSNEEIIKLLRQYCDDYSSLYNNKIIEDKLHFIYRTEDILLLIKKDSLIFV